MYETADDMTRLQALLDESHASMGQHMRSIFTAERRLTAQELIDRLQGMKLLTLATVTRGCEPRVGPVDGLFYRGAFWFGSAPNALRFQHIRERPAVSATHLDGEQFSVTVHGTAELVNVNSEELAGLRELCLEIYGDSWLEWGAPAQYARIDAKRMYTYFMREAA